MKSQPVACRAVVETGGEGDGDWKERKRDAASSPFSLSLLSPLALPFLRLRHRLSNVIQLCRVLSSVDHFTQVIPCKANLQLTNSRRRYDLHDPIRVVGLA